MDTKTKLFYSGIAIIAGLTTGLSAAITYREAEPELISEDNNTKMAEGRDGPAMQKFTHVTQYPDCSITMMRVDFLKGTKIYVENDGDYTTIEKVVIHPPAWNRDKGIYTYYLDTDLDKEPQIFLEAKTDFQGQIQRFDQIMNLTGCL